MVKVKIEFETDSRTFVDYIVEQIEEGDHENVKVTIDGVVQ